MAAVTSLYARAFADVILSAKLDPAKAVSDLQQVVEFIQSNPELRTVWESPSVPLSQKLKLLDALAEPAQISKQARNFVGVLIEKHRLRLLLDMAGQLKVELNQRMGVADAEVFSARDLAPEERTALEAQLAKTTGKTVRAHYSRDASLLGGALVRIGSTIYDGSVRGQLQAIKKQIATE
jgi:F-type H+-transporting ATPase subunit delta